jgi:GxxExxY protein
MNDKDLTGLILKSCFEVMNELGNGFLESVYKNALIHTIRDQKLTVEVEKTFEVYFRDRKVGLYKADIVVEDRILIELKCCKCLMPEHQSQVINYLKASQLSAGLLINFGNRNLEYKRLLHPSVYYSSQS